MRSQLLPLLVLGVAVSVGSAFASNEKVLHSFSGGTDGSYPVAAMVPDRSGNLYGTTRYGGANGQGTVFELTNSGGTWNETILYSFAGGNDGASPAAAIAFDAAVNIYGTTRLGGPDNYGTVFELSRVNGTWQESVLYSFTGGNDGGSPQAALTIVGNALIGTAPQGGAYANGVVFGLRQVNGQWREEVLYSFVGGSTDGAYPYSTLILDKAGISTGRANPAARTRPDRFSNFRSQEARGKRRFFTSSPAIWMEARSTPA